MADTALLSQTPAPGELRAMEQVAGRMAFLTAVASLTGLLMTLRANRHCGDFVPARTLRLVAVRARPFLVSWVRVREIDCGEQRLSLIVGMAAPARILGKDDSGFGRLCGAPAVGSE
ncbi:MAG: hypothetical protein C4521_07310 [Actinobacteria bacterium]|nr:MAG: hypothetical protein C4521_07310 [Actinomycetota bacterium]